MEQEAGPRSRRMAGALTWGDLLLAGWGQLPHPALPAVSSLNASMWPFPTGRGQCGLCSNQSPQDRPPSLCPGPVADEPRAPTAQAGRVALQLLPLQVQAQRPLHPPPWTRPAGLAPPQPCWASQSRAGHQPGCGEGSHPHWAPGDAGGEWLRLEFRQGPHAGHASSSGGREEPASVL